MTPSAPTALADSDDLTIFYIVEPPKYEIFACYLLASIRTHFLRV
jgi:hypothetical protein